MKGEERERGKMRKKWDGEGKMSSPKKCDRQINKRLSVAAFNPLGDCSIKQTPCMMLGMLACLPCLPVCNVSLCVSLCASVITPDYLHSCTHSCLRASVCS